MGSQEKHRNSNAAAKATLRSRQPVAMGRKALHSLLMLCGLLAVKAPWAADAPNAPATPATPAAQAAASFYSIREGDLFGLIDAKGRVVPAQYDSAEDFSDGLALVTQDGRSLFIDKQGRVQLQLQMQPPVDRAWSFSEGLAAVKVGALHGYIDKRGTLVIEPQFSFARPFSRGLAYVGLGRSSSYITADGQAVWRSATP